MACRLRTVAALASFAALTALPLAALGSETSKTRTTLRRVVEAIDAHLEATGERPARTQDLGIIVRLRSPRVSVRGGLVVDAWGTPLIYEPGADGYALRSAGANRRDDGGEQDDLVVGENGGDPNLRRAQSLLPVAMIFALAPFAWAALRRARRDLQ